MNYTHDKNQIVFLKDADIISAFNEKNALDEVVLSNGIPSYELFKKTYDELSTYDNNLSNYVKDHINVSVDNISALLSNTILSVNGISVRVNELCSELSTAHNTLSTALSNEIEKLSTSLSNTVKLSVEQLCSEIMSNDVDIAEISGKVDFLLSVGTDSMEYKGTVPEYKPAGSLTSDYHLSAFLKPIVKDQDGFIKNGFMYRLSAVQDTLSDHIGNSVKLGVNDYFIVNADTYLSSITFDKLDIIRDASVECKQLSVELSTELCACELSVNGISVRVNELCTEISTTISRLSAELSTELCACELSVNGISAKVNTLCSEISTELSACELSVAGISARVNTLCSEISAELSACELSVNGLSINIYNLSSEQYKRSEYLSGQVQDIQKDIKGGVNYKGHLSTFYNNKVTEPEKKPYPYALSDLFGYFYNTHGTTTGTIYDEDSTGKFIWKNSIPVNNGWLYCVKVDAYTSKTEGKIYTTLDGIKLSDRDYIIIHDHVLSAVQLSNITRDNIDIIETQDDDYVRLAKLREVSSWLSNDYTIKIQKLSADLSGEIDDLALSVTGLSDYVDSLTLSVNGLSVKTATICSELSIAHNALSTALSNEIEKLSTALSTNIIAISSDLSNEIEKLSAALSNEISNDCMHYKGNLIFDANDASLTATFIKTFGTNTTAIIKLGDFFRFNDDHTLIEGTTQKTTWKYEFEKNDFIIFKNATIAKSVTSEDFVIIKDYDKEILRQYSKLTAEVKVISDDICLSTYGISTYVDSLTLSVNGISVEVDRLSTELSTAISSLSTELSTELCCCELSVNGISARVNVLCSEISTELSACELSVNGLSNYINTLELSVNGISARVNTLCTEISTDVILSVEELQNQIISNDADISAISSDLSVLDYHYNRTFTEEFYQKKSVGTDLSVDVLNIVDGENTNNQYTLQFLSGTLVLVQKS